MSQRSIVRYVFSVVVVFLSVWAIALLYWRFSGRTPDARDIVLAGIALPALVIAAFVGLHHGTKPAAPALATASKPPAAAATALAAVDNPEPASSIALLDSSLCVPAGHTIDDVAAVARQRTPVDLHDRLKRADGSRIFAREDNTISLDDFDESLLPHGAAAKLDDEHWRALMLAGAALDDLLARHTTAGDAKPGATGAAPAPLELHVLLPARWQEVAPTLVAWLDAHVARLGRSPSAATAQTHLVTNPAQALAVLDELNRSLNRSPLPTRHIVLACDSWLSESAVNALDRQGALYSIDHVDGLIPGEGACALLVALRTGDEIAPAARIHRIATSAVTTEHDDDRTVARLLDDAYLLAGESDIRMATCALVSDASQSARQRNEIAGAAATAWPAEKADDRCLHLGLANGESGAVLALGTVAVAAAHCLKESQPTFAVTHADPLSRAAALVTPPWQAQAAVDAKLPV